MKKCCFIVGVLAVNVFGMHNNEASSSKNSNNKRLIPYEQRFVQNKKHITSAEIFEKFSDNELKRRFSEDDMEIDLKDPQDDRRIYYNYHKGDISRLLEREYSFSKNQDKRSLYAKYAKGWDHAIVFSKIPRSESKDWNRIVGFSKVPCSESKSCMPDPKSRVIDTITQGYVHIIQECHPNVSRDDLISLDAVLSKNFYNLKEQLTEENVISSGNDDVYSVDLSSYAMKEGVIHKKIEEYTNAISKVLSISDTEKQKINEKIRDFCDALLRMYEMDSVIKGCVHILQKMPSSQCKGRESHLMRVMKAYLDEVCKRSRYNREKTLKASNDVEDFINEWINEPNTDDEVLVRRWLGESKESTDPESFIRALFESVLNS